jgi:putative DNA primase/helicase
VALPLDYSIGGQPGAIPLRPVALRVSMDAIPAEIKALRRWVCWRYVLADNRWTKVPFQARVTENRKASVSAPDTWAPFNVARACYENGDFDGIGFVLCLGDGYVGIDLDHVVDARTGEVEPWAEALILKMPGYWELSPSQTGLRHIRKGTLPPGEPRRRGQVEMYDCGRFLTITGVSLEGWINGAL